MEPFLMSVEVRCIMNHASIHLRSSVAVAQLLMATLANGRAALHRALLLTTQPIESVNVCTQMVRTVMDWIARWSPWQNC